MKFPLNFHEEIFIKKHGVFQTVFGFYLEPPDPRFSLTKNRTSERVIVAINFQWQNNLLDWATKKQILLPRNNLQALRYTTDCAIKTTPLNFLHELFLIFLYCSLFMVRK
jgi:hypothetical protein